MDEDAEIEEDIDHAGRVAAFRTECATAWLEHAEEGWQLAMLRGGPLDTMAAPRNPGAKEWTGAWASDAGEPLMVTYEWVKDPGDEHWHGEFSGSRKTADVASEVMEEFFAEERAEPEPEPVDLDKMSTEDALAFLREDNERRISFLLEETNGQVDLTEAFDSIFIRTFVDRILLFMSPKIHTEASLDYENERSLALDKVEDKYNRFQSEREEALAKARLQVQQAPMAPPGMPVHNGRVTMPSRRIRRGG